MPKDFWRFVAAGSKWGILAGWEPVRHQSARVSQTGSLNAPNLWGQEKCKMQTRKTKLSLAIATAAAAAACAGPWSDVASATVAYTDNFDLVGARTDLNTGGTYTYTTLKYDTTNAAPFV